MSPADLFYYSAAAGIWIGILILLFVIYRTGKLMSSLEEKIADLKYLRSGAMVTILNLLSNFLNPRRRGDRYE